MKQSKQFADQDRDRRQANNYHDQRVDSVRFDLYYHKLFTIELNLDTKLPSNCSVQFENKCMKLVASIFFERKSKRRGSERTACVRIAAASIRTVNRKGKQPTSKAGRNV